MTDGVGGGALGSRVILGCIRERAGQASKQYSSVNSASAPALAFLNNGLEAVSQIKIFSLKLLVIVLSQQ